MKQRFILNILIVVAVCCSIFLDHLQSPWFDLAKPLTTLLVMGIPLLAIKRAPIFGRLFLVALLCCLLGDVLLLRPDRFLFGLLAFLVAHLLFARSFVLLEGFQAHRLALLCLLGLGAAIYLWLYPGLGQLKLPVALYIGVILFMAWQGLGIYLKKKTPAHAAMALGTLFFLFSDTAIAVDRFVHSFDFSGAVILGSYWLAIALMANAAYHVLDGFDPEMA